MHRQGPNGKTPPQSDGKFRKFWPGLALALLSLAVLFQLTLLGRDTFREMPRLIADMGQPAVWRSARYSQGRRFAQYVLFLNQKIPPNYRVVLPPDSAAPRAIATTPLMQFFLLPRTVINCTSPDCLDPLSLQDTAVLTTGGFPGAEINAQGRLEQFDAEWGVLLPKDSVATGLALAQGYSRAVEIVRDFLLAAAWLAALALAGFLIVRQLLPPAWGAARLGLGYGLGLALLSLCLALASLAGIPLRGAIVFAITLLLLIAASASLVVTRRRSQLPDQTSEEKKPGSNAFRLDPWHIAFAAMAILSALLAIGKGYSVTDELVLWGVKGHGIAADGAIQTVTQWGTNTVAYPLHIPLAIAASSLLLGEALPASKLLFPGYALALALLLYQTLLQLGVRRLHAGLATLAAITAPLVFRHSTLAYANLAMSFYLFGAVALLTQVLASDSPRSPSGAMLLSGVLFAAAAWTRPEGLAFSWLMIGGVLLAAYLIQGVQIGWRQLALCITPLLAYSGLWLWLKSAAYSRPLGRAELAPTAVKQILSGDLHFPDALYIGRALLAGLFGFESWGLFGMLIFLVLLGFFRVLCLRRLHLIARPAQSTGTPAFLAAFLMTLCSGIYLLGIAGMYYLTSYDSAHDISWWVSTGLDRMLMPGLLLLWAGGVAMVEDIIQYKNTPSLAG